MLDCDTCHGWYHGSCVSITEETAKSCETWTCDACQLREAILKLRGQFQALAAEAEAAKAKPVEAVVTTPKSASKRPKKGKGKKGYGVAVLPH